VVDPLVKMVVDRSASDTLGITHIDCQTLLRIVIGSGGSELELIDKQSGK
jgi:hypothetical protein